MNRTMRKHPKALSFLFLTEMWERYGFYVVQGMLVLYMTKALHFSDSDSYTIFGVFSALAYISPMLGGLLADRYLGFKIAVIWGGLFLCLGYAMLSLPWPGGFYLSLATIIVGNGLFKPNVSSLLGALYKPDDMNRDTGYTIFYIGINLGILLAGISSGVLKNYFGWHVSFASASIGIIIGIITFVVGIKWGEMKYQSHLVSKRSFWANNFLLICYCFFAIGLISLLLRNSLHMKWLLPCVGVIFLFFVFYIALRQDEIYRKRMLLLNMLIISAVIFWTIHLQMFFSATLFIDRLVDKHIFGMDIPTTVFYPLEGLFVILIGPAFAWSWQTLSQNNKNPSPFIKFILGIGFAGLGYLAMAASTYFTNANHLVSPLWPVLLYLLVTIGEVLLSPTGLSAVTVLSPPRLTGMMMGIWFIALGFGGEFAGILANQASIPASIENQPILELAIYRNAFLNYAFLALGISTGLFILQWFIKKIMAEPATIPLQPVYNIRKYGPQVVSQE